MTPEAKELTKRKGRSAKSGPPSIDKKLVDEYVDVRSRSNAFKPNVNPHLKRLGELEELLLKACDNQPAADRIVLKGNLYLVPVSPRHNESEIKSVAAVHQRLGLDWLLANCKITLGAVKKAITDKAERAKFIATTQTGDREIQEPVRIPEKR